MPGKYLFSSAQRFAVWEAYNGQCFWCGKPIEFRQVTIDHVIAETYLEKPEEFARIKTMYALDAGFCINDFENWVPAHSNCNSAKGKQLFPPSPAMVAILNEISKRAPKARATCEKVLADKRKGKIIGQIEVAVEEGVVSQEDIRNLFAGIEPSPVAQAVGQEAIGLHILRGWQVVRMDGRRALVTDGQRMGMTSAEANPDPSWLCPTCLHYGPWNGVMCLTCGRLSEPN